MADFGTFRHGGTNFPLATGTGNTSLRDADPAIFYLLEFYSYILTTYIGARLVADATAIGAPVTAAVVQKFPYPPERYAISEQEKFPGLFVFRKSGKFSYRTTTHEHDTGRFGVAWLLPPLIASQAEWLEPHLNAAKNVLNYLTDQGWDPGYTPTGGALGDQPWVLAGLETVGIDTWSIGAYPGMGNLAFPALICEGLLLEREGDPGDAFSGRQRFTGVDAHVDIVDTQQATLADLVQFATWPRPTITSTSPVSGPIAGSTSATLTGTGFRTGTTPIVTFGGVQATSVVVASATSITCVTPAHAIQGVCDIAVINIDGQSGKLLSGFTYT